MFWYLVNRCICLNRLNSGRAGDSTIRSFQKKPFALADCQCRINSNMNRQLYALKIKLASLNDPKKIAVLKLKIQQLEKSKS